MVGRGILRKQGQLWVRFASRFHVCLLSSVLPANVWLVRVMRMGRFLIAIGMSCRLVLVRGLGRLCLRRVIRSSCAEHALLEVVLIESDVAVAVACLAKGYAFARWARRVTFLQQFSVFYGG